MTISRWGIRRMSERSGEGGFEWGRGKEDKSFCLEFEFGIEGVRTMA